MESLLIDNPVFQTKASQSFIESNTTSAFLHDMRSNHIIPVFTKDNEPLISHTDFISIAEEVSSKVFKDEVIIPAHIRVSHPIKGRIPDAKDKPANQLLEKEKTIYYERMMFLIEIPSIRETIDGNTLNLTVGGVKSYAQDNLYNRKGSDVYFGDMGAGISEHIGPSVSGIIGPLSFYNNSNLSLTTQLFFLSQGITLQLNTM